MLVILVFWRWKLEDQNLQNIISHTKSLRSILDTLDSGLKANKHAKQINKQNQEEVCDSLKINKYPLSKEKQ